MPDDLTAHSPTASATPLAGSRPTAPLAGTIRVPGDKSISHRALMFGALAVGRSEISGLLEGEDVLATAAAMRALGAAVARQADGRWLVDGVGLGGLAEPLDMLDLGNSGTAARLLLASSRPSVERLRHRRRVAAQPADGPRHRTAVALLARVSLRGKAIGCRSPSSARRTRCRSNTR